MHDEVPSVPRDPSSSHWSEWVPRVPGLILGQWGYISTYGLPSVTIGFFFAYLTLLAGRPMAEFPIAVFVGMSAWLPFLAYFFNLEKVVERKFQRWDRWVARKMITSQQRKEMRSTLLSWYQQEVPKTLPKGGKLPPLVSAQTPKLPDT